MSRLPLRQMPWRMPGTMAQLSLLDKALASSECQTCPTTTRTMSPRSLARTSPFHRKLKSHVETNPRIGGKAPALSEFPNFRRTLLRPTRGLCHFRQLAVPRMTRWTATNHKFVGKAQVSSESPTSRTTMNPRKSGLSISHQKSMSWARTRRLPRLGKAPATFAQRTCQMTATKMMSRRPSEMSLLRWLTTKRLRHPRREKALAMFGPSTCPTMTTMIRRHSGR
mmetsp:Transcript_29810/g.70281  ORF Transcript_29810/g.70281 Transcript_29810/m.70281 type:complete len:224 (-) Transcript_29810:1194-1865(-)